MDKGQIFWEELVEMWKVFLINSVWLWYGIFGQISCVKMAGEEENGECVSRQQLE